MDLIFTNKDRKDLGVLQDYELDLAFGADENNFECTIQAAAHCCEAGSLLYMAGTEYGGIVDSVESNTESKEVIYSGRTWHGILNSKVLEPDSGEAYLVMTGEANEIIASLLSRMGLTDLFAASSGDSGLTVSGYKMNRYISGYDGIRKMLKSVGGKLKMAFGGGKVVLSAAAVHDYTQDDEFDADLVPFRAKRNYKGVNHLICLGSGQMEARMVVHLYSDKDGNISQEQTQFGLDEITAIFEYTNIKTEADLLREGMEKFGDMKSSDEISIDFDADSAAYDVGDIIGAVDNITGLMAYATIAKKIVTIKNGRITVSLSPDTAKSGGTYEIGGSSGGGGEPGADGADGVSCTHSWNGTTLTVTSASGTSSADLKGEPGAAGYTPVKGVDYFDGQDGKDGADGSPGKDGYTPQKGVDYFDGAPGADGKDGYTPVKGVDYFDGKDGSPGVNATINGVNALTVEAGEGVEISQSGSVMTISSPGGGAGLTMDLLWENAKPTSSFAAQTIALNHSGYKFLIGDFGTGLATSPKNTWVIALSAGKARLLRGSSNVAFREVEVVSGGLYFDVGKEATVYGSTSLSTNNNMIIPLRIYGVK